MCVCVCVCVAMIKKTHSDWGNGIPTPVGDPIPPVTMYATCMCVCVTSFQLLLFVLTCTWTCMS